MLTNILGSMVRFEEIKPGLQSRTFSTGSESYESFNLIGIVQRGDLYLELDNLRHELEEWSLFCIPHKTKAKVIVPPGSHVWLLGYHLEMTSVVIGGESDSQRLDVLMRQLTIAGCSEQDLDTRFLPLLVLLRDEFELSKHRSRSVICSIIRILLISLYRFASVDATAPQETPDDILLQRFRQWVELEYRNRRAVAYYCDVLNITYDRLHAVCKRNLDKSPLQLINHRVLMEALARLTGSSDSIQTIANGLGYNDASQFSHFFKKNTNTSPAEFRKLQKLQSEPPRDSDKHAFSDWP